MTLNTAVFPIPLFFLPVQKATLDDIGGGGGGSTVIGLCLIRTIPCECVVQTLSS